MKMVKLSADRTKLIFCPITISKLNAIIMGYKPLIEKPVPEDYSIDTYKITYEDTIDGVLEYYIKL